MLRMSATRATYYVRQMVKAERRTAGDTEGALTRISRGTGIGFWTLSHLRKGNAKTCDTRLFERLRSAYLDLCERQIAEIQLEIAVEKAVTSDDDLTNLEAEAAALAEKIAARRALK